MMNPYLRILPADEPSAQPQSNEIELTTERRETAYQHHLAKGRKMFPNPFGLKETGQTIIPDWESYRSRA